MDTVVVPAPGGMARALNLMSVMCSPAGVAQALRAAGGGFPLQMVGLTAK
jgi:hypothetical protein